MKENLDQFDESDWDELFALCEKYFDDLGEDTGRPVEGRRSREAFPAWVQFELSAQVSSHSIRNWRKGYASVIAEGHQEIREALDRENRGKRFLRLSDTPKSLIFDQREVTWEILI